MSLFRSGSKSAQTVTPDYTGLQVQTAVSALPIPIVYGRYKIAPNVIWYENFQAIPTGSGSSGGGKGLFNSNSGNGTTGYDYTAAVIMALCEGPIVNIDAIWRGQSVYTLAELGLSLFLGTTPQTAWSYLTAAFPNQALAYQGSAYVCASTYDLSSGATLDNHNFEILGSFNSSGINGVDADPALIINDFLTNAQCGIGFPPSSIATPTLFGSGGDASLQTYCAGVGIALSAGLIDQETASSAMTRWLNLCNTAAVWSGGQLKFIPYGDTATVAGTVRTAGISLDVPAANTFITPQPTIYVCPAAAFIADLGVTYGSTGQALTKISSGTPSTGEYLVSPAGTYVFSAGDENVGVNIAYQLSTGANYVPNLTPVYDLGDDDYLVEEGQDPLQVTRSDPYEASNIWRVEIAERANAYNLTPIEARDQNAIELFGARIASTVTAHEICDPEVGAIAAQLMLQRAVYIRNTYKFRLSWECCLLEPMDLVTLTDSLLGLNKTTVRITEIEEDESGYLEVTAEEFPQGVATATLYATDTPTNNPVNRNVDPGQPTATLLWEPPDEFAGGLVLSIAATSDNPLWGGCNVFMATSEAGPYSQTGVVPAPARLGVTTADLPPVTVSATGQTLDAADTLSVDLSESAGVLSGTSDAGALALDTPCYVGGEIVCFANATLTGANKYNLTYLPRGCFGTEAEIVDHPAGTVFCRLDNAILDYEFNQSSIGQTVYFKFQPFNVWGGGVKSLADCPAQAYTFTGAALASPLPDVTGFYVNYEAGFEKGYWDEVDDFRPNIDYEIRQGTGTWDTALPLRIQAHPPFIFQGNGTFQIKARCQPIVGLTVYSENAATVTVAGNQLSLNLLASWDEKATGWAGTFDNGIAVDAGDLRLGGAGNVLGLSPLLSSSRAATAVASGNTIPVTSLNSGVTAGMAVADTTTANVIPAGAVVQAITPGAGNTDYGSVAVAPSSAIDYGSVATAPTSTIDYGSVTGAVATVTINPGVSGGGVVSGDVIVFSVVDVLDLGGIITNEPLYYTIPAGHIVNAGSVVQAAVNGSTQIVGVPLGQNILSIADFLNSPDVLGSTSTQYVDGWIEIALSQDGSTWGAWQKFVPGVYPAMAWKFRLALESSDPNTIAYALAFNYQVQLPSRIDHYQNQTATSAGLTITFARNSSPSTPAPLNGGPGTNGLPYYSVSASNPFWKIAGLSLSQLTITFYTDATYSTPTSAAGFNIDVEGY